MKKVLRKPRPGDLKELAFLEALAQRCPRDNEILKALGNLYTRAGKYAEGLKVDLELSRLCADESQVWYNLACSYALLNFKEEALAALRRAIEMGYNDAGWIRTDADLNSLKSDQRFMALLRLISP